jgi:hypothetical protein
MLGDMERDVDDVQGRMDNVLKTIGKFLQTKSEWLSPVVLDDCRRDRRGCGLQATARLGPSSS